MDNEGVAEQEQDHSDGQGDANVGPIAILDKFATFTLELHGRPRQLVCLAHQVLQVGAPLKRLFVNCADLLLARVWWHGWGEYVRSTRTRAKQEQEQERREMQLDSRKQHWHVLREKKVWAVATIYIVILHRQK